MKITDIWLKLHTKQYEIHSTQNIRIFPLTSEIIHAPPGFRVRHAQLYQCGDLVCHGHSCLSLIVSPLQCAIQWWLQWIRMHNFHIFRTKENSASPKVVHSFFSSSMAAQVNLLHYQSSQNQDKAWTKSDVRGEHIIYLTRGSRKLIIQKLAQTFSTEWSR